MAEDEVRQDDAQDSDAQSDDGQNGDGATDLKQEVAKWKALARRHEDMWKASGKKPDDLKRLVDAERRLHEAEEASKSELQKLTEKAATSDRTAAEAQRKYLRLNIAYDKGLPRELADRLQGENEEELQEDADRLLALLGKKDVGDDGKPTRPKERLRSGAAPDEEPDETDPRKLADIVPRR